MTTSDQRRARLLEPRLARELKTIRAMLDIYCRAQHGAAPAPCDDCEQLFAYATKRLAGCPYGSAKPTCTNCRIHCYGPREREQVREVMRFAGPRMMLRHPYLALMHVIDGHRPAPPKPRGAPRAAQAKAALLAEPDR
jgi:hypothetical protein